MSPPPLLIVDELDEAIGNASALLTTLFIAVQPQLDGEEVFKVIYTMLEDGGVDDDSVHTYAVLLRNALTPLTNSAH